MLMIMNLILGGVFLANVGVIQPVNDPALDKSCITATSKVDCLHDKPIERWIK